VREQDLSVDDAPGYLREFEHVTLARVLIARYQSDRETGSIREAISLLERLLQAAEEGKRMGSVVEILALLALAQATQGDIPPALISLGRALNIAEPEGYVRSFLDEGKPMAELLGRLNASREGHTARQKMYIHKLLAAFGTEEIQPAPLSLQPLIEPLSENELEVLRLLRTELSGPEIARQRMVSLSTIRTHTQHIYAKLGVNNRRAAIRRAEELGLL
jgi:LuxR family transcriptional regulator, maltose regulon positive regulatory protein